MPEVATLAELNTMIDRWGQEDENRRIRSRPRTIGKYFAAVQPLLAPLPQEPFETMLHASELVVYDGRDEVARHERLIAKGGTRLELDHYLEALVRKPDALPGATALEQARSAGRFTPVHDAWWDAAVKAHGERDGTCALIAVLLLGRQLPHQHLVTGIAAALKTGALTAGAAVLGARKAADADAGPAEAPEPSVGGRTSIAPLPTAVRIRLPPDKRRLPSVAHYGQLLRLRRDRPTP